MAWERKRGAWAKGGGHQWRKVRAAVLAANALPKSAGGNDGRCTMGVACGGAGVADCVHHTLGRNVTGDDPRFLRACCTRCNQAIGDPSRQPDPPAHPVTRW